MISSPKKCVLYCCNMVKNLLRTVVISLVSITGAVPLLAHASSDTRLYVALDTSGSMQSSYFWITESIRLVRELIANNSNTVIPVEIYAFTDKTNLLAHGNDAEIESAISSLDLNGSTEDGFIPINHILKEGVNTGAHILLITDEDRDRVQNIELQDLLINILEKGITIHSIISMNLECGSGSGTNNVIGLINIDTGINNKQQIMNCTEFTHSTKIKDNEYAMLALNSGGSVWDLIEVAKNNNLYTNFLADELSEKYFIKMKADVTVSGILSVGNPVTFNASNTYIKDGIEPVESWEWDFNRDGVIDDYGSVVASIFYQNGSHDIYLWLSNYQDPQIKQKQIIHVNIEE